MRATASTRPGTSSWSRAEGDVVASAVVEREVRDGVPVYDVWGHVTPELRRRGIGGWLLD